MLSTKTRWGVFGALIAVLVVVLLATVALAQGASSSTGTEMLDCACAIGSPGILSGNAVQIPINIPING